MTTRPEISVEADWAGQPWTASDRENWRSEWTREANDRDTSGSIKTPRANSETIEVAKANEATTTQEDSQADTAVQEANTNTIQPSEAEETQVTPADYSWVTDIPSPSYSAADDDDEKHNIEDFQIGKAVDMTGTPEDFGFTQEQMDESNNSISLDESWKKAQEYADEFRNPVSKFADNFIGNMKDRQLYNFLNTNGTNVSLTDASHIHNALLATGGKLSLEGALKYDDYSQLEKDAELANGNVTSAGLRIYEKTGEIVNKATAERVATAIVATENGNTELADKLLSSEDVRLRDDFKSFASNPANKLTIEYLAGELLALGGAKLLEKLGPKALQAIVKSDNKLSRWVVNTLSKTKAYKNIANMDDAKAAMHYEKTGIVNELLPENNMEEGAAVARMLTNNITERAKSITNPSTKDFEQFVDWINNSSDIKSLIDTGAIKGNEVAEIVKDALMAKSAADAKQTEEELKSLLDKISDPGTKEAVAAVVGLAGSTAAVSARPTGYATPEGKSLDSKDIVEEYQDNPYEGDDAVTIQSREGEVTLPAKQAVIVAEAEGLSKSDGYTKEVKDLASKTTLSETNRGPGNLGYSVETSRPTSTPAEIVSENDTELTSNEKSGIQQSIDVVQAIFGGRDLNNDGTITAQEQIKVYTDTITSAANKVLEPILNGVKNIAGFAEKVVDAVTPSFIDDLGMLKYLSPKQYARYEINKTGLAVYDAASNVANVIAHPVAAMKNAAGDIVDWTKKQYDEFKSSLASNVVNLLPSWSDTVGTDVKKSIAASIMGIAEMAYAPALAVRAGANYISSTVREIAHLQGYDMTEDQVRAINLAACNLLGITCMPVGTIFRDVGTITVGKYARTRSEIVLEFGSSLVIPVSDTIATTEVKSPSSPNSGKVETTYGTATGTVEDADSAYSGAVVNAKNSNLATDYNAGLEQEMNNVVSDGKVKGYIISIYKNEPDYIRKAINKVLSSYREII